MNHDHDHGAMLDGAAQTKPVASGSGNGVHMMMMAMTFHGGYHEAILFDAWETKTVGAFVGSWLLIFFLSAFCEALKTFRDVLAQRAVCDTCSQSANRTRGFDNQPYERADDNDLTPSIRSEIRHTHGARILSLPHTIQTILHIVQMTISYLLMLIAMTFNTYLFIAVILGAGLGHFLFGWRRASVLDHNDHCH